MKTTKQCIIISSMLLIVYLLFVSHVHAHRDKPHNNKSGKLVTTNENDIPFDDLDKDLNTTIPRIQADSNKITNGVYTAQTKKVEEEKANFFYTYGILILGMLTALSFFITVTIALTRRKIKGWNKYHHLFAILTGLLLITHAIIAIWLHYFFG